MLSGSTNDKVNTNLSSLGKKYIPPHLRKRIAEKPAQQQSENSSLSSSPWGTRKNDTRFKSLSSSGSRWSFNQKKWDDADPSRERELFGNQSNSGINFDQYNDIPVEVSGRQCPECNVETFDDFNLVEALQRNIELTGFKKPTPIQKHSINIVLRGRDLMACAQTGSGKTAAFLLPTLNILCKTYPEGYSILNDSSRRKANPLALILAPTRELAQQIFKEAEKFSYRTPLIPRVIYGGADIGRQMRELERGCDVLIATPGRLVDLMERGKVVLDYVEFFILDEADRMLDMGFEPQIRWIVDNSTFSSKVQTLMFSATFPIAIQKLAKDFLHDYLFLQVGRIGSTTNSITQTMLNVDEPDKRLVLVDLINTIPGLTLVFVETKKTCDQLEMWLEDQGFDVVSIHGDRNQREREEALRRFRSERTPILVATDVAARGLDIDNVTHVINFDLPRDITDYVHRIGRTGRAGHTGNATSFINKSNITILPSLITLLDETNQEVPAWLISLGKQAQYQKTFKDRRSTGVRSRYSAPRIGDSPWSNW